jgi:hypothetical protein
VIAGSDFSYTLLIIVDNLLAPCENGIAIRNNAPWASSSRALGHLTLMVQKVIPPEIVFISKPRVKEALKKPLLFN